MEDEKAVAASFVLDVNFVIRVEPREGGVSYRVESVTGPNPVEGFDLFYNAAGEEIGGQAHNTANEAEAIKLVEDAVDSYLRRESDGLESLLRFGLQHLDDKRRGIERS